MITIKDTAAMEKMFIAGQALAEIFVALESHIVAGISTLDLDRIVSELLSVRGLISQTKGYMGYRHVSCISLNDEVVHGVPSVTKVIRVGDLVKVDVCAAKNGYCADMTRCFFVGGRSAASPAALRLVDAAYVALDRGIGAAVVGGHLSDISAAVQEEIERSGFGVVRSFAGHGIGRKMHEEPEIVNYGRPGKGPVLRVGMAFALEPMVTLGKHDVSVMADGWTAKTVDGSLAAHVEDTIIITEQGPRITTRLA